MYNTELSNAQQKQTISNVVILGNTYSMSYLQIYPKVLKNIFRSDESWDWLLTKMPDYHAEVLIGQMFYYILDNKNFFDKVINSKYRDFFISKKFSHNSLLSNLNYYIYNALNDSEKAKLDFRIIFTFSKNIEEVKDYLKDPKMQSIMNNMGDSFDQFIYFNLIKNICRDGNLDFLKEIVENASLYVYNVKNVKNVHDKIKYKFYYLMEHCILNENREEGLKMLKYIIDRIKKERFRVYISMSVKNILKNRAKEINSSDMFNLLYRFKLELEKFEIFRTMIGTNNKDIYKEMLRSEYVMGQANIMSKGKKYKFLDSTIKEMQYKIGSGY